MTITEKLLELGALNVGEISATDIPCDPTLRSLCNQNACGNFNRNYACPPFVPPAEEMIATLRSYKTGIVFQIVGELEDSYDFEGMQEVGATHHKLCHNINDWCKENVEGDFLVLGSGGCNLCPVCGAKEGVPCRFPDKKLFSMDICCIFVSALSEKVGMKYINGQDTVTYFGVVLTK